MRKHFKYYIDKADVPRIRMYDLKHTYAATMMSEGKEAYLFSKRMGHKNIKTTIIVYGYLSNEVIKRTYAHPYESQNNDKARELLKL